ncbi:MAG: PatU [Cyanobacteria bacterium P01_C01_bin.120]
MPEDFSAAHTGPSSAPSLARTESSSAFIHDPSIEMPPISELGELPSVQDHFQAVLKDRLQIEISQNPPLFPWESSVTDYPIELSAASAQPWLVQLRSLPLPTALPEDLLTGLLNRCQELIVESLQPGVQLVKAVENLFPDQPQAMDQIAGLVLANATVRGTATRDAAALKAAFPNGYEGANPQQQVTLTMLAAKDILDTLTLTLTSDQPAQSRQWVTTEGCINITAEYQSDLSQRLNLTVDVPRACQLSLPSLGQTVSQTAAGTLNLSLPKPQTNRIYPVEVHFSGLETPPLTFAICWME